MSTLALVLIFGGMMVMVAAIPIRNSVGMLVAGLVIALIGTGIGATGAFMLERECEAAGGISVDGNCFEADGLIELEGR